MIIDTTIFLTFLITTLAVGIKYGTKIKSLREYALGNKNFSTLTITATITATYISGSMLHITIANVYKEGISYSMITIGIALGMIWIGKTIGVRMARFMEDLSIPETLGNQYGSLVRIISAFSCIFVSIGIAAAQFKASSFILSKLFDMNSQYATIVSAIIVIFYSALGGIRSVAFTDVLQFFTFSILIPILFFAIWKKIGNVNILVKTVKENKIFWPSELFKNKTLLQYGIGLAIYGFLGGLRPSSYQRLLISRDKDQIKIAYYVSTFVFIVLKILLAIIAILMLGENPNLKTPDSILSHIVNSYLGTFMKGLMSACIMAMVMSTADSSINSASVVFINDILSTLNLEFKIKDNIIYIRLISAFIGTLALILALGKNNLLGIVLMANSYYMPIVIVPLMLLIFGYKSDTKITLIGMLVGLITVIFWENLTVFKQTKVTSVVPGMAANIIVMYILHYIIYKQSLFEKQEKTIK